jgi:hypothetical protein
MAKKGNIVLPALAEPIAKVEDIVKECVKRHIPVDVHHALSDNDNIVYRVTGFSKSGGANIWQGPSEVICVTRYETMDDLQSFKDLSGVAWRWYLNYKDREPFTEPDHNWLQTWIDEGRIEAKVETVTKYVIK